MECDICFSYLLSHVPPPARMQAGTHRCAWRTIFRCGCRPGPGHQIRTCASDCIVQQCLNSTIIPGCSQNVQEGSRHERIRSTATTHQQQPNELRHLAYCQTILCQPASTQDTVTHIESRVSLSPPVCMQITKTLVDTRRTPTLQRGLALPRLQASTVRQHCVHELSVPDAGEYVGAARVDHRRELPAHMHGHRRGQLRVDRRQHRAVQRLRLARDPAVTTQKMLRIACIMCWASRQQAWPGSCPKSACATKHDDAPHSVSSAQGCALCARRAPAERTRGALLRRGSGAAGARRACLRPSTRRNAV
jgi:hypothetical protein